MDIKLIGIIFVALGVARDIRLRNGKMRILLSDKHLRGLTYSIGIALIIYGLFSFKADPNFGPQDWMGTWRIGWGYSSHFDNPAYYKRGYDY